MRVLAGQRSACCPRDCFSWVSKSCRHPGKIVPWRGVAALARQRGRAGEMHGGRRAAGDARFLYDNECLCIARARAAPASPRCLCVLGAGEQLRAASS